MDTIDEILGLAPVIPVLVVDDVALARPLAKALVAGGLPVLEVTLRTPQALDVISAMRDVPGAVVGAGTVTTPDQLQASLAAGAQFVVSPGLTDRLGSAARTAGRPFLPGVASAGDIMRALDFGFERVKFFPAVASGGIAMLKALAAPFPQLRFCPTGGITLATAGEWLDEPCVAAVGGSWLASRGERDWDAITMRARSARAVREHSGGTTRAAGAPPPRPTNSWLKR